MTFNNFVQVIVKICEIALFTRATPGSSLVNFIKLSFFAFYMGHYSGGILQNVTQSQQMSLHLSKIELNIITEEREAVVN